MMKTNNIFLHPLLRSIGSLFLLGSTASVAGVVESDCSQAQLDQLNAHWHTLILERDPGARAQLIREHRKLVNSIRDVSKESVTGGEYPMPSRSDFA